MDSSDKDQSKAWEKEHSYPPVNLNHGNKCNHCNYAVIGDIGRSNHFDTGMGEGS